MPPYISCYDEKACPPQSKESNRYLDALVTIGNSSLKDCLGLNHPVHSGYCLMSVVLGLRAHSDEMHLTCFSFYLAGHQVRIQIL